MPVIAGPFVTATADAGCGLNALAPTSGGLTEEEFAQLKRDVASSLNGAFDDKIHVFLPTLLPEMQDQLLPAFEEVRQELLLDLEQLEMPGGESGDALDHSEAALGSLPYLSF